MRNIWAFQWEHRGHCKHPGRAVLEVCWKLKDFLIGKLKLCEDQSLLMKQIDFGSIFPLGKVKWNYLLGIVSRVSFMPVIQCLTEFSFLRNIASRLWPEITLQTGMGRLPGTGFSTARLGNCKKTHQVLLQSRQRLLCHPQQTVPIAEKGSIIDSHSPPLFFLTVMHETRKHQNCLRETAFLS